MLQIEIGKVANMSQSGKSLKTLYQDKHTPILDLLVRESIQNSLDAGLNVHPRSSQYPYVELDFITGSFCPKNLNVNLEGISEPLNSTYTQPEANFLAIRDKYTVGLTGPLSLADVRNYQFGNLRKLVYDICKPQDQVEAGGSCGIGKTIFFRVGIGLVVYYSRIFNEETSRFQSRLAVCYVEDPESANAMIPRSSNGLNSGIAWWGQLLEDGHSVPTTNEQEINAFLETFGIEPYRNSDTGTTIIIPYIDAQQLIKQYESAEGEDGTNDNMEQWGNSDWLEQLQKKLKVSTQKWYFPRMFNRKYQYGKFLKFLINGEVENREYMIPLFRIWQQLYNSAATGEISIDNDFELDVKIDEITLRNAFVQQPQGSLAGRIAYCLVDKKTLGMIAPNNHQSPFKYLEIDGKSNDGNSPIIAFCRKPGMIVAYHCDGDWLKSVPKTSADQYLLAIFVLNSTAILNTNNQCSFEEYVRQCEHETHDSWYDSVLDGSMRAYIKNIKRNVSNKLCNAYQIKVQEDIDRQDSGLGNAIASLILPPRGFGKKSSITKSKPATGKSSLKKINKIRYTLLEDKTTYSPNTIVLEYQVDSGKKDCLWGLETQIASSEPSTMIPIADWETQGGKAPFEIDSVRLEMKYDGFDGSTDIKSYYPPTKLGDYTISLLSSPKKNTKYGIKIETDKEHVFSAQIALTLKIHSRDVQFVINPIKQ